MFMRYLEGPPALDIKLPSRWLLGVPRGEAVEVEDEDAERLLALGWEAIRPSTHPEEDDNE